MYGNVGHIGMHACYRDKIGKVESIVDVALKRPTKSGALTPELECTVMAVCLGSRGYQNDGNLSIKPSEYRNGSLTCQKWLKDKAGIPTCWNASETFTRLASMGIFTRN